MPRNVPVGKLKVSVILLLLKFRTRLLALSVKSFVMLEVKSPPASTKSPCDMFRTGVPVAGRTYVNPVSVPSVMKPPLKGFIVAGGGEPYE